MKRNRPLDVLRLIAVVLVIGFHLHSPSYPAWTRAGWIGVDLFFVLSGFLISGLLFLDYKSQQKINWKRFIVRRGLKIWPPFYVYIGVTFWITSRYHAPYSSLSFLRAAGFVLNYHMLPLPGDLLGHLWSLCVEEHFYVLLPIFLILLALLRGVDPFRSVPGLCAGLSIATLAGRLLNSYPSVVFDTHYRLDSLFVGVTLGYLHHFRESVFAKLASGRALVAGLALCAPAVLLRDPRMVESIGVTLLALGFSLIVGWSVQQTAHGWPWKALSTIGARSYSIYLWHEYSVVMFVGHGLLGFWCGVAFALAVGCLMSELVERPTLALRNMLDT